MIKSGEVFRNYLNTTRDILESVYLDSHTDPGVRQNFQTLTEKGHPKRERGVALLNLVRAFSPKFITNVVTEAIAYKPERLPFSDVYFTFRGKIGSGGMNDVFLLESRDSRSPSWVIKIPHRFKNDGLFELAKAVREEYLEISRIFGQIPGLVLDEESLLVHGPRGRKFAPAVLQRFMCTQFRDIFNGVPRGELVTLLRNNPAFSLSVAEFVRVFEANQMLYKQLDILGDKNLSVVTTCEGPRLLLLDPHYRGTAVREKGKEVVIRERVEYLKSVSESVKQTA